MDRRCDQEGCHRSQIVWMTVLLEGGPKGMGLCPGHLVELCRSLADGWDDGEMGVVSSRDERGGS